MPTEIIACFHDALLEESTPRHTARFSAKDDAGALDD
jgi:hypothetical protein